MTRSIFQKVTHALIGVVLLAQLAVSAYACPGLARAGVMQESATTVPHGDSNGATAASSEAMPIDCASMAGPMDPEFANLCAEHCHYGQQSDQTATLTVPAAFLIALYSTPLASEPAVARRSDTTSAVAAASPPLAILYCCFRI